MAGRDEVAVPGVRIDSGFEVIPGARALGPAPLPYKLYESAPPEQFRLISKHASLMYLVSGVAQVLLTQLLHYEGAARRDTMLTVLCTYAGMLMVGVSSMANDPLAVGPAVSLPMGRLVSLAIVDVAAHTINTVALLLAGSSIFQMVNSSLVVFTAILAFIFLGRRLQPIQYMAVAGITGGMLVGAIGVADGGSGVAEAGDRLAGALLALTGTACSASLYVLNERVLKNYNVSPERMCFVVGLVGTALSLAYVCLYTMPRWDFLVTGSIEAHAGSIPRVMACYVALFIASYIHNVAYFYMVGKSGAVAAGVLQAGRTALVIMLSGILFCGYDTVQCFTFNRSSAVGIICIATLAYSMADAPEPLPPTLPTVHDA